MEVRKVSCDMRCYFYPAIGGSIKVDLVDLVDLLDLVDFFSKSIKVDLAKSISEIAQIDFYKSIKLDLYLGC